MGLLHSRLSPRRTAGFWHLGTAIVSRVVQQASGRPCRVVHTRSCGSFPLFFTTSLLLAFSFPAFFVGPLVPPHASSLLGRPLFPDSYSRLVESGQDDNYASFFLVWPLHISPAPRWMGLPQTQAAWSGRFPLENDSEWQTPLLVWRRSSSGVNQGVLPPISTSNCHLITSSSSMNQGALLPISTSNYHLITSSSGMNQGVLPPINISNCHLITSSSSMNQGALSPISISNCHLITSSSSVNQGALPPINISNCHLITLPPGTGDRGPSRLQERDVSGTPRLASG